MQDKEVFYVEDFFVGENEIDLCLFNVTAFYRKMASLLDLPYEKFIRGDLYLSRLKKYSELFCSINVDDFFSEESVPYVTNKQLFGVGCFYPVEYIMLDENRRCFNAKRIDSLLPIALKAIADSNYFRRTLKFQILPAYSQINQLKYCAIVNVGFGSCCFIFDECNVTLVDCSDRETCRSSDYQSNINAAIDWIKNIQGKKEEDVLHIDTFLLTHPHYDHYSGVKYLIDSNMIDGQTNFLMNEKYKSSSITFSQLKARLSTLGIRCIDPISGVKIGCLEILFPDKSPIKCRKTNNSSVVSKINVVSGNFVIPGDIENSIHNEGWNVVSANVQNIISNSMYYMLSHHGSKNGFDSASYPQNLNLSFCSTRMGKHSGVPDQGTLALFHNRKDTNALVNNQAIKYIAVDFNKRNAWYV